MSLPVWLTFSRSRILISSVLNGLSSLCVVEVLVSCAPPYPKLLGGEKVAVGDIERLWETLRASLFGETRISCAEDILKC